MILISSFAALFPLFLIISRGVLSPTSYVIDSAFISLKNQFFDICEVIPVGSGLKELSGNI
jgi:hypothetical protein